MEVLEGRQDLEEVGEGLVDGQRVVLAGGLQALLEIDFSDVPPTYSMTM